MEKILVEDLERVVKKKPLFDRKLQLSENAKQTTREFFRKTANANLLQKKDKLLENMQRSTSGMDPSRAAKKQAKGVKKHKKTSLLSKILSKQKYSTVKWKRKEKSEPSSEQCREPGITITTEHKAIEENVQMFKKAFIESTNENKRNGLSNTYSLNLFMYPLVNEEARKAIRQEYMEKETEKKKEKQQIILDSAGRKEVCAEPKPKNLAAKCKDKKSISFLLKKSNLAKFVENRFEKQEEKNQKKPLKREQKERKKSASSSSIRGMLDEIAEGLLSKTETFQEIRTMPYRNKSIAILLSELPEVPAIRKEYLEKAPMCIKTRIFREGITKKARKLI